jgi:hypothetical protein
MSSPLKLEIRPPTHGWAETTITLGDASVFIDASDVGPDCFEQLAGCALYALEAYEGIREAVFFEEPGAHILGIRHCKEGKVSVTIHTTRDMHDATARRELVARIESTAFDVALAIWRGLRAHETMLNEASAAGHWNNFPARDVEVLGKLLQERRQDLP